MEDTDFINFYNEMKENNLIKNKCFFSEPIKNQKIFMIDFKSKNEDLTIFDYNNSENLFIFNSISITYHNKDLIEINNLTLYNGELFMDDVQEILYPNKIFNKLNFIEEILKIFKAIEYFDFLISYHESKKKLSWMEWKDLNDFTF